MIADPDDPKARKFEEIRDTAELTKAEERFRNGGWWAKGPIKCLGPGCGHEVRKPRILRQQDGKKFVTVSWCSQECLEKWRSQFTKLPGPHWEKYNEQGELIGYVIPKHGFIPIDDERLLREREE